MKVLLDRGADIYAREHFFGATPLHSAAMEGCVEAVKILLDRGANIEVKDEIGFTALHHAAAAGMTEVTKVSTQSFLFHVE